MADLKLVETAQSPEQTENTQQKPTLAELNEQYQKDLESYKADLAKMDKEALKSEEDRWIEKLNDFDKYIRDREYKLPASVEYNGKLYTRSEVFGMIKTFINEKCEIEWKYAPKMVEFTKWFIGNRTKISYPYLDSVLRLLDQFKYKGVKEWESILTINEYFKQCTAEYQYDQAELYHLSLMHNAVLEQMQLNEPVGEQGEANPKISEE